MRTMVIAVLAAMTAGTALAQTRPAADTGRGGQNAVSNQRPTDPLSGDGGGSLLGQAAHNATAAQNATTVTTQATSTQGVSLLYGVDTASTAVGIAQILDGAQPETSAQTPAKTPAQTPAQTPAKDVAGTTPKP